MRPAIPAGRHEQAVYVFCVSFHQKAFSANVWVRVGVSMMSIACLMFWSEGSTPLPPTPRTMCTMCVCVCLNGLCIPVFFTSPPTCSSTVCTSHDIISTPALSVAALSYHPPSLVARSRLHSGGPFGGVVEDLPGLPAAQRCTVPSRCLLRLDSSLVVCPLRRHRPILTGKGAQRPGQPGRSGRCPCCRSRRPSLRSSVAEEMRVLHLQTVCEF
mmetsp:Transcript_20549/g.50032  ORF Transcript_20549/g.50032 Transcript_20549/m.50032 type:complete len:214 (+) Transcript_20549:33-674(+)